MARAKQPVWLKARQQVVSRHQLVEVLDGAQRNYNWNRQNNGRRRFQGAAGHSLGLAAIARIKSPDRCADMAAAFVARVCRARNSDRCVFRAQRRRIGPYPIP